MSAMAKPHTYRITSGNCEPSLGSRFTVRPGPVKSGSLCLFKVRDLLIVGRWIPNVAGADWIIQPSRWIHISKPADVRLIGAVV